MRKETKAASITPGTIAGGGVYTENFDVPGARQYGWCGIGYDTSGPDSWIRLEAYCSADDVVTVWAKNQRTSNVDPGTLAFMIAIHMEE